MQVNRWTEVVAELNPERMQELENPDLSDMDKLEIMNSLSMDMLGATNLFEVQSIRFNQPQTSNIKHQTNYNGSSSKT